MTGRLANDGSRRFALCAVLHTSHNPSKTRARVWGEDREEGQQWKAAPDISHQERWNSASTSPLWNEGSNIEKCLFFFIAPTTSLFLPFPSAFLLCQGFHFIYPSEASFSFLRYMFPTAASIVSISLLARSDVPAVYPVSQIADPARVVSLRCRFGKYDIFTEFATTAYHRI